MTVIIPSKIENNLLMFDVGHGDSMLIRDCNAHGLLVDIGSQTPKTYCNVPLFIENAIPENKCGLLISHFHWDHYSLFRCFANPEALFSKIYLPDLPITGPENNASHAMQDFLKVSCILNYGRYRILPDLLANSKLPKVWCREGTLIKELNPELRVFWPDFTNSFLRSEKIWHTANAIRERIKPIMSQFNIREPSELAEDYSLASFFNDLEREIRHSDRSTNDAKEVYKQLAEIEGDFLTLANTFSIAFRTHYNRKPRYLFLGDIEGDILNRISIPNSSSYDFIKASHHGTEFGSRLENMLTRFLLISRVENSGKLKAIHEGYINKINYEMLLSTGFLGNCFFV